MKTRRAVSLLELLVIMSASTIVLTLCGLLLHRAMRLQIESRAHVDAERTALRLASQFRRDVHAARAAVTGNAEQANDALLQLELADGRTAQYSRDAGTVLRMESGGGKPEWREEFLFPTVNELTIEEEDAPPRLILTVTANPKAVPPAGQPLAITRIVPLSIHAEAVVGRDLRLGQLPAVQEKRE
jgi:hypothetical protein